MARLTKAEKEAVCDVLAERIAAGEEDLADALGLENGEEVKMMSRLISAKQKLENRK